MKEYVLSITRGDSQTYNLTFTDEDDVAIDRERAKDRYHRMK